MNATNQVKKVNGLASWGGGKGVKQGELNANRLLLWVFRWRWVTELVVQRLIGCSRRPCWDYVQRGLLTKIEPKKGFSAAYVLGRGFLEKAKELHEYETRIVGMPYTQHGSAIPFLSNGDHNEAAQLAAIEAIAQHCGMDDSGINFRTEWELRYLNQQGAIPDFTILAYDAENDFEHTIWYEVERTPKYNEDLCAQLKARENARKIKQFQELVWIFKSEGKTKMIADALRAELIPQVYRRKDGRLAYDLETEGWNPAKLLEASRFQVGTQPI